MGGPGSGNWLRWNTKAVVESFCRLDIRDKRLKTGLRPGLSLSIGYRHLGQEYSLEILLDWTPCNYGGQRPWFLCRCGRRRAVLYINGKNVLCRDCLNLSYRTRQIDKYYRALRRGHKIKARLGCQNMEVYYFPKRPKGLHKKTFELLAMKYILAIDEFLSLGYKFLRQFHQRV